MIRDYGVGIFALAGIGAVIVAMRAAQAFPNPTIAALLLLLVVLATATAASLQVAVTVSVTAMLAFNYFLLPPFGTLTIADPQNWVALLVFLSVSIVASNLSGALRQRSVESLTRQRDLRALVRARPIPSSVRQRRGAATGPRPCHRRCVRAAWRGTLRPPDGPSLLGGHHGPSHLQDKLREVARHGNSFQDGTLLVTAIRLGGAPIGSLAIIGAALSDTVLQSIANLAAIGLERARGQEAHGAGRGGAPKRRAARDGAGRAGARVQDAAHVDEGGRQRLLGSSIRRPMHPTASSSTIVDEDLDRAPGARHRCRPDAAHRRRRFRRSTAIATRRRHRRPTLREFERAARRPSRDRARCPGRSHGGRRPRAAAAGAAAAARQRREVFARRRRPSRSRASGNGERRYRRAQLRLGDSRARAARGSSSASIAARRRATFPAPAWGSRSCSRSREAHGGSLTVSSTAEDGTAFTLSLPAASRRHERRPDSGRRR